MPFLSLIEGADVGTGEPLVTLSRHGDNPQVSVCTQPPRGTYIDLWMTDALQLLVDRAYGKLAGADGVPAVMAGVLADAGFTKPVVLGPDFHEDERCNVLLVSEAGDFEAWLALDEARTLWLGVGWHAEDHPSLLVFTKQAAAAEIAAAINEGCGGWYVRRCYLDGVNLTPDGKQVRDPEEECE